MLINIIYTFLNIKHRLSVCECVNELLIIFFLRLIFYKLTIKGDTLIEHNFL